MYWTRIGALLFLNHPCSINVSLIGTIPSELAVDCSSLTSLQLSYNRLSGSIPTTWATQMQTLILNDNQLTGTIPASITSALTSAQRASLKLSNNLLTGTIPNSMFNYNFNSVNISNNNISVCSTSRTFTSHWGCQVYPQSSSICACAATWVNSSCPYFCTPDGGPAAPPIIRPPVSNPSSPSPSPVPARVPTSNGTPMTMWSVGATLALIFILALAL